MERRKLMEATFSVPETEYAITLFRQEEHYSLRVAYYQAKQLIKETNNDVSKEMVQEWFSLLEQANLETVVIQDYGVGYVAVYYNENDCLLRYFDRRLLQENDGLLKLIEVLLTKVDHDEVLKETLGIKSN